MNHGTNSAPVFDNYTVITAGGNSIYRYRANPRIYDLDQDGLKDLLLGNDDGRVYFYKNIGTNANPVFNASPEPLKKVSGIIIDAYYGSRFHIVDWTDDGDPDMLISGFDGYIEFYENTFVSIEEKGTAQVTRILTIIPNPVKNKAVIEYSLNRRTFVQVNIYSVDGRLITSPISRYEDKGNQRFTWNVYDDNGRKLPAGVYFVELQTGSETITERIVVVH